MLPGAVVRSALRAANRTVMKICSLQRVSSSNTMDSLGMRRTMALAIRNSPLGAIRYDVTGEMGQMSLATNSVGISSSIVSGIRHGAAFHVKWSRKYQVSRSVPYGGGVRCRNYCQNGKSENGVSAPKVVLNRDKLGEKGASLESEVVKGTVVMAKRERYGALMWQKLKALPAALKRFVGLHGPMTLDKVLPFFNLMFVGAGLGILVGTTTVVSLGIWIVNRNERWQELTAKKLGAYLTYQTGISIEYESMSASWSERRITLKNVKIVRDPSTFAPELRNVTALNLQVANLTVSVSLLWMLQGNGILKHVTADGVKGYIDQRHLDWTGWTPTKRTWQRGDFFLDSFRLSNTNISLFMIAPARELKIQVHSIDCDRLRKQWLLHDILSAKSAYGIFDGSLFSLTRLPSHGNSPYHQQSDFYSNFNNNQTSTQNHRHPHHPLLQNPSDSSIPTSSSSYSWFWGNDDDGTDDFSQGIRSSLKIDGVNADLISTSSTGPISWLTEGKIDIDMDLEFLAEFWEEGWHYHLDTNTQSGFYSNDTVLEREPLLLDIKLKLNNLRADIPISTNQLTLINRALVIPVVAYMNTNYTCIPLAFPVHMSKEQFDGAWSPWEAGLFEAISAGCAQQFLTLVKEQQSSTNIQKHILMVIKSLHRGLYFLHQQIQGYYSLWYFNNDDHPEDMYAL